ncbi:MULTISPECIES: hypothetical protein [unclassified Streptomyces]|uniref:hypothetical protein n=1 Tax=unclassified Streptomyces TaxID=2593676 RepID=UPI0037F1C6E2
MPHHRPAPPPRADRHVRARGTRRGVRRAVLAAGVVGLLVAAGAGCGDAGGLEGAGSTPTAVSPERLWPDLPPASSPAFDIDEVNTEVVKGVTVPGGAIRRVAPVEVVRREIAAHPDDYDGSTAPYRGTAARMSDCDGSGPERGRCPVLRAYYRDLTGDGRDELTLGFRLLPGELTAVRVYTVEKGRLVQIMGWEDAVSGVELAGRSLIIRSPSEVAGYEYRLQWTWDADQNAMLLTHDEMRRTGGRPHAPRPARTPGATPAPSGTGTGSPSGAATASPSPTGTAAVGGR